MTRKTNRRFLAAGMASILLALLAGWVHQETGLEIAYHLIGALMLAAFVFLVVLGIMPWLGTLSLKYPIHNTEGFRDDYAPEPGKEAGRYLSQGWRRKRERASLRNLKAFGLFIEPDEKS